MSLLDDVSIVVTPNGYKAGELYAVIPVPTEGAEEGTNMDFSSGTSPWALNSNWSLGGVGVIADGTSNSTIWQGSVLEDNKQYIVTYTLTDFLQGSVNVELSGSNGISRTIAGTYTEVITSGTSPTTRLSFEGSGNFKVTLSNVIVKEYTSADMDVTRATAATRVDENGLVNYAEVIGGEEVTCGDFECAVPLDSWSTGTGWSIADGSATYNGLSGTQNIQQAFASSLVGGSTYIFTIEVLANEGTGTNVIDLSPSSDRINNSHLEVGTHTFTHTVTATSNSILIYGRSGEVFEFDNVSVKEVTRDNVPRIDYTGGGCPHILAEPQRTNLVTESEDFTTWSIARATLGTNITAPNGEADGYSIIATAVNDDHFVYKSFSVVNTTVYTYSAYLKKGSKSWARLWNTSVGYADFDLENGVVGTQSSVVGSIDLLNNGWYRCSIVYTAVSTGINSHRIYTLDGDNDKTFLGDGSTINLYTFGAQLEIGSYPTSYIPTSGSTVTRNQDIFTRDGIGSLINSTEGVLFLEIAALSDDGTNRYISISNSTLPYDNYLYFRFMSTSNRVLARARVGGVTINTMEKTISDTTAFNKFAIKWKSGDYAFWINGVEELVDTSSPVFAANTLNEIEFSFPAAGGGGFPSKVKQLQVYDTSLSDTQLAALTS